MPASPRSIERRSARPSISTRVCVTSLQVGGRHRADAEAALVGCLHQPVRDEPRQRLAHRGEAYRKLLGEAGDMQLLAGQQPGRKNVRAQPLLNGGRQASRPFVRPGSR